MLTGNFDESLYFKVKLEKNFFLSFHPIVKVENVSADPMSTFIFWSIKVHSRKIRTVNFDEILHSEVKVHSRKIRTVNFDEILHSEVKLEKNFSLVSSNRERGYMFRLI